MGSYDGAETCELIGIYTLYRLAERINKEDTGLYRDDGLILLRELNGKDTDKARKDIIKIFKDIGFNIEIKTNLKVVDFLDVTLNLSDGTYRPYKKPDDKLSYIHTSSNHPQPIIRQIPSSICRRLSDNSSSEQIFDSAKEEYETALKNSGFPSSLKYTPRTPKKRNRKRNIIWFNPPFSKSVSTNIGKKFLILIDKHFPRSNKLHKIFNRNSVKVSYSCTENMAQIITKHNKQLTSKEVPTPPKCNCRKKETCPLNGNCLATSVIYQATVKTASDPEKIYLGLTEGTWKQRSYAYNSSFSNRKYINSTALSRHIWELKDNNQAHEITWSIKKTAPAYSNISKRCLLCLQEKMAIITFPEEDKLLNKRSELISKCRHENKFLLRNYDSWD
mgnify:CR=1 FL=1